MPSSTEETYERLVRKQKFSLLLPLNIFISPNSLTSIPSIKEVLYAGQNRDEASQAKGHRVIRQRIVIKDDDDNDLVV